MISSEKLNTKTVKVADNTLNRVVDRKNDPPRERGMYKKVQSVRNVTRTRKYMT